VRERGSPVEMVKGEYGIIATTKGAGINRGGEGEKDTKLTSHRMSEKKAVLTSEQMPGGKLRHRGKDLVAVRRKTNGCFLEARKESKEGSKKSRHWTQKGFVSRNRKLSVGAQRKKGKKSSKAVCLQPRKKGKSCEGKGKGSP